MSSPLYAALDLGSNSFHMIVGRFDDGKLHIVDRHKEMVRLAAGLDAKKRISEETIEVALQSLARFSERLRDIEPTNIRVVGTNTLRAARNASAFIKRAERILGASIDIIAGTEEARLIFLGVSRDFSADEHKRLVVDIGGGSTELIVGTHKPLKLDSLYMGCVSFTEWYFPGGELTKKNYKRARNAARNVIEPVAERFDSEHWQRAVGASGTIKAIAAVIATNGFGDDGTSDHKISKAGLDALETELLQFEHIDNIDLPGLPSERRASIAGGLAVLSALFGELEITEMEISDAAAREGILFDLAGRNTQRDIREKTLNHLVRQFHIDRDHSHRIDILAQRWLDDVHSALPTPKARASLLLHWAARTHEIGLAIAHSGYHKHGAYVLQYGDLPGFSRNEQRQLAFLVLNHRRKLRELPDQQDRDEDWLLASVFRLACVIYRRRQTNEIDANVRLCFKGDNTLELSAPAAWLEERPLTQENLEQEVGILANKGIHLKITTT